MQGFTLLGKDFEVKQGIRLIADRENRSLTPGTILITSPVGYIDQPFSVH